jgi:dTMP kinase
MTRAPRFITLEGGEGAGKSTQIRHLAAALEKKNISVVTTREPGGSPGAEEIRKLLVTGEQERWDALTETLLVFAARSDHVARTIRPALADKKWVLCDRFTDSTYAYQGAGRGLARETIRRMEALVLHDFRPDLTLLLDIPPEAGLARADARRGNETRYEQFDASFHEKLRQTFLAIAHKEPMRCEIIDASQDEQTVAAAIWNVVKKRYKL